MADFPPYRHTATGSTLYITINNASGHYWDAVAGSYDNPMVVAQWANYDIVATETPAGSYQYIAAVPAALTADALVYVTYYDQAGGAAAITDTVLSREIYWWDGTAISDVPADTVLISRSSAAADNVTSVFTGTGVADDVDLSARSLVINNDTGVGAIIAGSSHGAILAGSGGNGITILGTSDGIDITGTTSGIDINCGGGPGIDINGSTFGIECDASAGPGVHIGGTTIGLDIDASAGIGVDIDGSTTGVDITGSNGNGITILGTTDGIDITGTTTGIDINCGGGPGIEIDGTTFGIDCTASAGPGVYVEGSVNGVQTVGTGGPGMVVDGSNNGVEITGSGGNGITILGTTDGIDITGTTAGIDINCGAGPGITSVSSGGNGDGFIMRGNGTGLDINAAEISLLIDPRGEPAQGLPPVSTTTNDKIDYLYKNWRNKKEQTATLFSLYNDAGDTVDHKATISEVGGLFTKEEMESG